MRNTLDALPVILQQVINAIQLSSCYALIAVGYTMVYGVLKLINFAHADVFMVGAYLSYYVYKYFEAPFVVCLAVSMAGCALVAVFIERVAYKPLRNAPRLSVLITAIGISLILEHGTRAAIGPEYLPFPNIIPKVINNSGGVYFTDAMIWVVITALILMVILTYIVQYSTIGKAMRAVSFDREAALLMGINVDRIISYTFAIGAAEAGAAGMLWGLTYPMIDPYMGMLPGIKAFVAAVVGGIGSVPGALAGSFILGSVETATSALMPSMYRDAIAFGILAVVLIVKPTGIFGIGSVEKV